MPQVSEYKTIARHDFSHFNGQVVLEHGACVHESVKFSVLATGIDVRRKLREQLLVKFSAYEFRRLGVWGRRRLAWHARQI